MYVHEYVCMSKWKLCEIINYQCFTLWHLVSEFNVAVCSSASMYGCVSVGFCVCESAVSLGQWNNSILNSVSPVNRFNTYMYVCGICVGVYGYVYMWIFRCNGAILFWTVCPRSIDSIPIIWTASKRWISASLSQNIFTKVEENLDFYHLNCSKMKDFSKFITEYIH